jgi:hypothetical protein
MRRDRGPRNERSPDTALNLIDLFPRTPHVAEDGIRPTDQAPEMLPSFAPKWRWPEG